MQLYSILFFAAQTSAYGQVGHLLSGAIASELLSAAGTLFSQHLLPDYKGDLSRACLWGDEIKSDHSYDWAKKLHFINPINDDPPRICSYNPGPAPGPGHGEEKDCPGNVCVVGGIRNYTARLLGNSKVVDERQRQEAFKFLIHFMGDLAQPLHATGRQRGGTMALARFGGRITNLHSIWDYMMFEKRITEDFGGSFQAYVQFLIKKIGVEWRGEVAEWILCPSSSPLLQFQDQVSSIDPISSPVCPEKWAKESNQVNCKNVWPKYKRKYELSGEYYRENILVEEKMLAKAGFRMAHVIDYIAAAQVY